MVTTPKQRILAEIPEGAWFAAMLVLSVGFAVPVGVAVSDLYPSPSDGPLFLAMVAGIGLLAILGAVDAVGGRILSALVELLDPDEAPSDPTAAA
jgi:hypothetical protein